MSYGGPCALFSLLFFAPLAPSLHPHRGGCVIRDAPLSSVASGQSRKTMVKPDNQVKDPAIAVGLRT